MLCGAKLGNCSVRNPLDRASFFIRAGEIPSTPQEIILHGCSLGHKSEGSDVISRDGTAVKLW